MNRSLGLVPVVILVLFCAALGCGGGSGIEPASPPENVVTSNPVEGPSGPPDLSKLADDQDR